MKHLFAIVLMAFGLSVLAVPAELDSAKWDYVESIIQYDADTRYNILLVSTEADLLPKIVELREKTEKQFQGTIKSLEREDQEIIYTLLQQEGLFMDLASLGKEATPEQIEEVLSRPAYTTDLEAGEVYQLAQKHSRTLINIKTYWEDASKSFEKIIADIPEEKQDAFRALLRQPEVLDVLDEHEDYTKKLGESFLEEPEWVTQKTDSLAIFYQNEHKKEIEEYQKEFEENPEMQKEMEESAEEYAREFGYDPEELAEAQEAAKEQPQNVTVNVTYNAYPYWFGYPYWYPAPMWRPYPWYYHCGFRYGRGGVVVVFGMPSYHYSSWFYRGPYRRYPSCARYHAYHHHRYPYTRSGFNNAYRRNNVRVQNNNIYVNGKNSNISQGKRYDYNQKPAQTRPQQPAYSKNSSTRPSTQPATRPSTQPSQPSQPATRPSTQPSTQPSRQPSTQPSTRPSTQPSQSRNRGTTQQYRANDYHRSNWNSGGGASRSKAGGGARRR